MILEPGTKYRYLGKKVHIVGVVVDSTEGIIVFKRWYKFRWNYEAAQSWLFSYFAVRCR